jgi:hypothetical protein
MHAGHFAQRLIDVEDAAFFQGAAVDNSGGTTALYHGARATADHINPRQDTCVFVSVTRLTTARLAISGCHNYVVSAYFGSKSHIVSGACKYTEGNRYPGINKRLTSI